jgi:hypothetical protein
MQMLIFPISLNARIHPVREIRQSPCGAFGHTSWRFTTVNPLDAEAAFPHGMLRRAAFRHVERTGLNAIGASNASATNVFNDSIRPAMKSPGRTCRYTCGIIAMEACGGYRVHVADWEFTRGVRLYPAKPQSRRGVILHLAAHLAGVATDTFWGIENN